jgi:GAF domain-containing protein
MNPNGFPDFTTHHHDLPATAETPGAAPSSAAVSAATHADLAAIVLGAQSLGAVLRRIAELAVQTIPGADEASVTLIERHRPKTVAFSGRLAATLDERQYETGFGPCLDAAATGQIILLDTHDEQANYPDFSRQARRHGIDHVLSVGMPTLQQTCGALNIYGRKPAAFDDDAVTLAKSFARYAAVALPNAYTYRWAVVLDWHTQEAMDSRAVIEQAKGIIMAEQRCSPDEAFAVLTRISQDSNRKVRDVAA